jgi:hypothetical protein
MKVLLVHTAHRQGRGPGARLGIMAISQGSFALAALLQDAGHQAEIVHLGLERLLDPEFSLQALVRVEAPQLVAVGLHWQHQALDVLEATREARQGGAGQVVVGGLTASLLHRQLIAQWPHLDAVIRGDAERPLLLLAAGTAPEAIPNLTWRRGRAVVQNAQRYVAGPGELDALCFSRLSLLRHHQHYSGLMTHDPAEGSLFGRALARRFNLPISRGCARSCPRCGGARTTLAGPTGRDGALFLDVERVLQTMREVAQQGIRTFYVSCHPADHDPGYYPRLFSRVRQAGLRCAMQIEAFSYLPDEAFLASFAGAFDLGRSLIILSPHGGPERRRRVGVGYSDGELWRCLARAAELGIRTRHHVGIGPPDGWPELQQAGRLALELRRRHGATVLPLADEVDPGSPWTRQTQRFGIFRPNHRLDQVLAAGWQRRRTPAGIPTPDYRLPDLRELLLALQGAASDPGPALAWLRSGLPQRPGQSVALLPLSALQADRVPRETDRQWTAAVWGCSQMARIQEAARALTQALPGAVALRALDRQPTFPDPQAPSFAAAPAELLTDGCRFGPDPCPAALPGRLLVAPDGSYRPCFAAPAFGPSTPLASMRQQLSREAERQRQLRGCGDCPARRRCPACIYLGPVPVEDYCRHMRATRSRPDAEAGGSSP